MIEHKTQFSTYNPALIRQAFLPDLFGTAPFSARMDQFNTVGIHQTDPGRISHEMLGSCPVGVEKTKQTGAMRQVRKQLQVVSFQPSVEYEQNRNRDHFTWVKTGLAMLFCIGPLVNHITKQIGDKIYRTHEVLLFTVCRLLTA